MDEYVAEMPPTSSATTSVTEPEVIAGISSAEGNPDLATEIRVDGGRGAGRMIVLLAAGIALGVGTGWWLRRRG